MPGDSDNSGSDSESAERMLEEALNDLTREEIERKKFDEPERGLDLDPDDIDVDGDESTGTDESESSESAEHPDQTDQTEQTEKNARLREEREMFERAMSDVERMETSSKYRSPNTPDAEDAAKRADAVGGRGPDDLKTPVLPKDGESLRQAPPLDEMQQRMKSDFEAWSHSRETPVVNLRGETTDSAISRLSSFLAQARHHEDKFVRIVTGRGRRSDGPPAIKLAVLEWLEGRGIYHIDGYFPERLVDGDYGSLIVELRDSDGE